MTAVQLAVTSGLAIAAVTFVNARSAARVVEEPATFVGVDAQSPARPPGPALNGTPIFEVNPNWPTTPPEWTWGQVIGIFADARGHVWTSSRSRISEWDPQGTLLQSWDARRPNGNWSTIHGLFVDHNGFVRTNARESCSGATARFSRRSPSA